MKRKLEIVMEFDDGPWLDRDTKEWVPTNAFAYAMDQINLAIPHICRDVTFVEAKLDGKILIDQNGKVAEEVKKLNPQYDSYLKKVAVRKINKE